MFSGNPHDHVWTVNRSGSAFHAGLSTRPWWFPRNLMFLLSLTWHVLFWRLCPAICIWLLCCHSEPLWSRDLVIFWTNVSRSFEPTFSLAVLLGVSPLRGLVWRPSSARPRFPVSARDVVGPDPARSIVAKIEKCNQVLWHSFNPLLSACMRGPCLFFLCPVVEVFVHTSHMMSHRTWFRALDHLSLFGYVSFWFCESKTCLIVIDISDIQRASRVSSSGSIHSQSELVIVPSFAFALYCFQVTNLFCSWNRSLSVFAEVSKNTMLPFLYLHLWSITFRIWVHSFRGMCEHTSPGPRD